MVVIYSEKNKWQAVKELPEGAWIKVLSVKKKQEHFPRYSNLTKAFMNQDIILHRIVALMRISNE